MIKIDKKIIEDGYKFTITTEEGSFAIIFSGALDLAWKNNYSGSLLEAESPKIFTITKENYYLYSLFEKLYEDVKNFNINKVDDKEYENIDDFEEEKKNVEERNNIIKANQIYEEKKLFINDSIEWHCDDFPYDEGGILKISAYEDKFIVSFEKSKNVEGFKNYSVRLRNSGSRYNPFNSLFMEMYRALIKYDPEYHQIHLEEISYQKRLKK